MLLHLAVEGLAREAQLLGRVRHAPRVPEEQGFERGAFGRVAGRTGRRRVRGRLVETEVFRLQEVSALDQEGAADAVLEQ